MRASQGEERRVFRRTGLSASVGIRIEDPAIPAREIEGAIVNIGLRGILARVDEELAEGTLCAVRFSDPETGSFEARGFVRNTRSSEDGGILVGIEFEVPLESLRDPSSSERLDGFNLDATKVLVVDDEPSIVELLYRFLSSRGCTVSTAGNGPEALDALRSGPAPDITVLDLRMPGMDGLEVLQTIREENLDAGKIWAISGYSSDNEAREALRLGAVDFVNKPLDLKYLEWSMHLHRAAS
ncbi:MAG: response regulator [Acidobacteria bacterium]|nr:response regulator [Acidobacteriota bacterium]